MNTESIDGDERNSFLGLREVWFDGTSKEAKVEDAGTMSDARAASITRLCDNG